MKLDQSPTPMGAPRAALTAAQRDEVFARRAEELAACADSPDQDRADMEALVFALGAERYALPAHQVHEVRPLGWLTRLPGTPPFFAGLINVRGRIVPVIDLRPLLGMPSDAGVSMSVVLVSHPGGDIALLATDRPTVRWLRAADLTEPPAGLLSGIDPSSVSGITSGLVIVLDAERLLTDPRLVVHHDVLPKA